MLTVRGIYQGFSQGTIEGGGGGGGEGRGGRGGGGFDCVPVPHSLTQHHSVHIDTHCA